MAVPFERLGMVSWVGIKQDAILFSTVTIKIKY